MGEHISAHEINPTKKRHQNIDRDALRDQAEESLSAETVKLHFPLTAADSMRLVHELQVHQIELEMQNAELRKVQEELETSLNKYAGLYAELYDFAPIGYFSFDPLGVIRAANLAATKLLGIERGSLVGKPFSRFIADADGKAIFSQHLDNLLQRQSLPACEISLARKDGSVIHGQLQSILVDDSDCKDSCILSSIVDVTVARKLSSEIQDAREYAENVVETVCTPLLVLDFDLKIITANHSFYETFKVTTEETIGNFIYDVGNRQWDIPKLRVLFEEILPHNTVINGYVVEHDFPGIGRKTILLNARQIFREKIGSRIILLAMEDISERRLAEDKIERLNFNLAEHAADLESANTGLGAFNYTVSHDLRQPLNNISIACQTIERLNNDILDEDSKGCIKIAINGVTLMNNLITSLLRFSTSAHSVMRREMVHLDILAKILVANLQITEPKRHVTFSVADGLTAIGDPELLYIVLENLIGNAWKYTGRKRQAVIELGLTENNETTTFFVRDNGPGFSMEDAEKLFIPFKRLPGTEEFIGHGIGLATVERIIRRHDGKLWAEGVPGSGATFYFTLNP